MKTIAILHGEISPDASLDEKDGLVEVAAVANALKKLKHNPVPLPFSHNVSETLARIETIKPDYVVNLVESLNGNASFIHFPPQLLSVLHIPFSGASAEAMFLTSHKILTKKLLSFHGIPTPNWQRCDEVVHAGLSVPLPVILKPLWEDASVGIDDRAVFNDETRLMDRINTIASPALPGYFVEQFIDGREINVSCIASNYGVTVLPPAEILFTNFPDGKPRIVGYDAKWVEDSFESVNTPRTFDFKANDAAMLEQIQSVAKSCWDFFGLNGYARVDFRIDSQNMPWVLEINANPCISPDSGFVAAARHAGIWPYEKIIAQIIGDH